MENIRAFLTDLGLQVEGKELFINAPNSTLIEQSIKKGQGVLAECGSLIVKTGEFTGRAAKDKYVVKSPSTANTIWWSNDVREMSDTNFARLKELVVEHLNKFDSLYFTDRSVGAHERHNIAVRLVTERPSHSLFSKHMFREKLRDFKADDFVILHAPTLKAPAEELGTRTGTVIVTCFDTKTVLIIGSLYAGEIKKSVFSIMNYILPEKGVLPMHAGANKGSEDISVFFGLSGTGKTTLSTDDGKLLIGDDEHGLSDAGVFNFEGGCYAKTYKLSRSTEPGIYKASTRFGALIENVAYDDTNRKIDFFNSEITENGRSSYPLSFIEEVEPRANAKPPNNIFFLTADAFGVLPPVSKLTKSQAMFYFVLGYTAKVAGTEAGITEPQATFSPCFGAPFMLRHPKEYAALLGHYLDKLNIDVWLVNTGWTGGPYGVGDRFPIAITRKIIRQIQKPEALKGVETDVDPIFGLHIPKSLGDISPNLLNPKLSWKEPEAYDEKAKDLAKSFHQQMEKFGDFYHNIKSAGPLFN